MNTTWKKEFEDAFKTTGDTLESIETTLSAEELEKEFDNGYGGAEGSEFTAWSKDWVYFPVVYDGVEWVGYAPRNPCEIETEHWGGQ